MKKILIIFFCMSLIYSCDILTDVLSDQQILSNESLSEQDVAKGLKEALNQGVSKAIQNASKTNGFYKNKEIFIPFPEEAQKVKQVCESAGLSNQVVLFEEKLNRAAEIASKEAKDIFIDAIQAMTIQDAISILKSNDNAATDYLKKTSSNRLYSRFYPIVKNTTDNIQLANYWTPLVSKYNTVTSLTGGDKVDTDLNNYVTNKTIDGIFLMVAKEESNIRKNPSARINDILKEVFGSSLNPYNN
jgi:hypothetical protein